MIKASLVSLAESTSRIIRSFVYVVGYWKYLDVKNKRVRHPSTQVFAVSAFPNTTLIDIWYLDPSGGGWFENHWRPHGSPVQITVAFEPGLHGLSSGLELALQPYVAAINAYRPSQTAHSYEASLPAATFGVVPMSTAGNWDGAPPRPQQKKYHLASYDPPLSDRLLAWAQRQLCSESQSGATFEDAISTFVFALRDSPQALAQGRAVITVPTDLVRSVCDMISWVRLWHAPAIHVRGVDLGSRLQPSSQLPETVTWELKSQAVTALALCERTALGTMDHLPHQATPGVKLSVWACLWQMILIYRKLLTTYTEPYRSVWDAGQPHPAAPVVATIEQLHRLLLVKYAAYFGSSSPIYHKPKQQSTWELLAGDLRLQRAWGDVVHRRTDFCKSSPFTFSRPRCDCSNEVGKRSVCQATVPQHPTGYSA